MSAKVLLSAAALGLAMNVAALAMDSGGGNDNSPAAPQMFIDPNYTAGETAIKSGDYRGAVVYLVQVVAANPRNADAHNYLGFSYRKLGDKPNSLASYSNALAIDASHRGANEYLGELYLEMNDLPKAEERLARFDRACFFGCVEYRELKKAIDGFKATRPKT